MQIQFGARYIVHSQAACDQKTQELQQRNVPYTTTFKHSGKPQFDNANPDLRPEAVLTDEGVPHKTAFEKLSVIPSSISKIWMILYSSMFSNEKHTPEEVDAFAGRVAGMDHPTRGAVAQEIERCFPE